MFINATRPCMMKSMKKTLSQTNPYLRDRKKRLAGLVASVSSSSAIEGIAARDLLGRYVAQKAVASTPGHPSANEQLPRLNIFSMGR